jgi:hypothetical protein
LAYSPALLHAALNVFDAAHGSRAGGRVALAAATAQQ